MLLPIALPALHEGLEPNFGGWIVQCVALSVRVRPRALIGEIVIRECFGCCAQRDAAVSWQI
jgi:hypothetical protein